MDRNGVYAWTPGSGGVHHHRIAEPIRVLQQHGIRAGHGNRLDDEILSTVDTVLAHSLHGEAETEAWHKLADVGHHRLIIDIDDLMWRPDWTPFKSHYTKAVVDRLLDNITVAHVVTTPTEYLADQLRHLNPNVHVVPNTIPAWLTTRPTPDLDAPTLIYQGSSSHKTDWPTSQFRQLAKFMHRHPDWKMHLYGEFTIEAPPDIMERVRSTGWRPIETYYRDVAGTVGIGPLADTAFNRAKSALRAQEYAALGIVAVLPDLPPYRGWVEDGVTGHLIRRHQTLGGVLAQVASYGRDGLAAMATAARTKALQWTTEANIHRWVDAWNSR